MLRSGLLVLLAPSDLGPGPGLRLRADDLVSL